MFSANVQVQENHVPHLRQHDNAFIESLSFMPSPRYIDRAAASTQLNRWEIKELSFQENRCFVKRASVRGLGESENGNSLHVVWPIRRDSSTSVSIAWLTFLVLTVHNAAIEQRSGLSFDRIKKRKADSMIHFVCPACGKAYRVRGTAAGKVARLQGMPAIIQGSKTR